jgi:hypothetical protein
VQGLESATTSSRPTTYWGLRKVIGEVFGKWGLKTTYVDDQYRRFHAASQHAPGVVERQQSADENQI